MGAKFGGTNTGFRINAKFRNNVYEVGEAPFSVPKIVPLRDYTSYEFAGLLNKYCGESNTASAVNKMVRTMSSSMSQAMKKQLVKELYGKLSKLSPGMDHRGYSIRAIG